MILSGFSSVYWSYSAVAAPKTMDLHTDESLFQHRIPPSARGNERQHRQATVIITPFKALNLKHRASRL